ncbi:hypothetical protein EUGRSUZ_B03246, partial [Eucalyptus grandis]
KNFYNKIRGATTTTKQKKNLPPGPPPLPIIGNLHQLGHLPHQSLWKLSKRYGPVMLIRLGSIPTVIVSSPSAAREVLKTHDLDCCSCPLLVGTGCLSYDYLDIAFVEYGDYWRELRKLCMLELFSSKRVQSFRYVREEEVGSMIKSITKSAESGTTINISENFMALTAGKVLKKWCWRGSPSSDLARSSLAGHGRGSTLDKSSEGKVAGEVDLTSRCLWPVAKKVIDEHQNGNKSNEEEDIVDLLLKMERQKTELAGVQLREDIIKAILMDVFLAGVHTVALVMDWTMAELARNPRAMRKAREEIRSCVGNKKWLVENDLGGLKYLKLVLEEAMRETMGHFKLFGYDLDPETRVQVNVWAIGRDPSLWKDPEKRDSRIVRLIFKGNHFELLIFGAGRRGCPGISMGMAVIELALANVLHSFDWKLPEAITEADVSMEK